MGPLQLNSHTVQKHLSGGQSGSPREKEIVCLTVKSLCFPSPTVSHAVRRVFVPREHLPFLLRILIRANKKAIASPRQSHSAARHEGPIVV